MSDYEYRSNTQVASLRGIGAQTEERQHADADGCARGDAALARGFDLLGQRWTGVVLGNLSSGPAGFGELARAIDGISDSMLSTRLTTLTQARLITRTVSEGPPLAVTYALTDAGAALIPALLQISRWAQEHLPDPELNAPTPGRR